MKSTRLLALFALLSTAAGCHPATPTPPVVALRPIAVHTCVAGASVWIDGAGVPTAYATPQAGDGNYPDLPVSVTAFNIHATAAGYPQYGAVVTTSGSAPAVWFFANCQAQTQPGVVVSVTPAWVPSAPVLAPLPAVPTRDQLARVHACFQGLAVTTQQLGTVPSWGPEIGMLTSAADRQTTYSAHQAAGCSHFVIDIGGTYQEAGVAYPNNLALANTYAKTDYPAIRAQVDEIIRAGLYPVVFFDGDDDLQWIIDHAQDVATALETGPDGDLTPYVVTSPCFDSCFTAPAAAIMPQVLLALDAAFPRSVHAIEDVSGAAFWGADAYSGAGSFATPAGQTLDVVLQEFDSPPGPPQPAPTVVSGTWDAEHNDYAPVFSAPSLGQSFMRIWQVGARTVWQWTRPADEPTQSHCVTVPVSDGPNAGSTACVFVDDDAPTRYTQMTPRGRPYVVAFELSAYSWTHGAISASEVAAEGPYFTSAGYDAVCVPTMAAAAPPSSPHRKAA